VTRHPACGQRASAIVVGVRLPDRDRKILWGLAHDSCALCRSALVHDAADTDRLTVVGEEAHVVSASPDGPRGTDPSPPGGLHGHENRILLCRNCHVVVDDDLATWTTPRLLRLRATHEAWARERVHAAGRTRVVRHPDDPDDGPTRLLLLGTGLEVWRVVAHACQFHIVGLDDDLGHPEDLVDLGDDFLRLAVEYGDMAGEVEDSGAAAVRDAQRTIGAELRALGEAGLLCFGARRMRLLTGGGGPDADWPESHLAVVQFDDPQIASGPAPHPASG